MKTSLDIMFAPLLASNDMEVNYHPVIILCRVGIAKITLPDKRPWPFIAWGLYTSYKTLESHC
jgi:hypothetical protein